MLSSAAAPLVSAHIVLRGLKPCPRSETVTDPGEPATAGAVVLGETSPLKPCPRSETVTDPGEPDFGIAFTGGAFELCAFNAVFAAAVFFLPRTPLRVFFVEDAAASEAFFSNLQGAVIDEALLAFGPSRLSRRSFFFSRRSVRRRF